MLTALRLLISNLWVPNSWHYHEMIHHVQHQMLSCWNMRPKQDDLAITISKTTQNLQAGHYSLVERLLYAGKPNIFASTWPFSFLHPAPRHQDALKCEARADPNGAVQSMQTPVLGPKFCQQLFNQFALDLQQSGIEHVIEKAVYHGISLYIHEIHINSSHQWNNFWHFWLL